MKPPLEIICVSMLAISQAAAAGSLSEAKARQAAVKILMGDPYGKTPADVARHIRNATLLTAADTICGKLGHPEWAFTVVVPAAENPSGTTEIKGYLCLDARTGKLDVAGLPFLD